MKADAKIWRSASLDATFIKGEFADFSYDMHTHETMCIALITRGAIKIKMTGLEITARAGDIYAIGADVPHAGWPVDTKGWALRTLYVSDQTLAGWAGRSVPAGTLFPTRSPIIRDRQLAALLRHFHEAAEVTSAPLAEAQVALELGARMVATQTGSEDKGTGNECVAIGLAKDYLMAHFDARLSLADIAEVTALPPYRLYRAFERGVGMTPHQFQRQARIR